MIVKVEVSGEREFVHITTQDKRVNLRVPALSPILARMNGRTTAYFQAAIEGNHTVELGDAIEGTQVAW